MSVEPNIAVGFLWFVAFLFSTTVHEAMHAFVAWKGGDPTAYEGGQVSLSPLPHIRREPIGMVVVPLITALTQGWAIGWASAPYDPHWAARHPGRAAVMSAAGPAGNLLIALVAFVLLKVGLVSGYFVAPDSVRFEHLVAVADGGASFAGDLLSIFLVLNVLLAVFNLLPVRPLDAGNALAMLLPSAFVPAAAPWRVAGVLLLFVLALSGLLAIVIRPLRSPIVDLLL